MLLTATLSFAGSETNTMVFLQISSAKGAPALKIVTEQPIGSHYTVYDSDDLSRLVIDFPYMDYNAVSSLTDVNQPPVQKVDVSSYDMTWGRLSRVEVVLTHATGYYVVVSDNEFVQTLRQKAAQEISAALKLVPNEIDQLGLWAMNSYH